MKSRNESTVAEPRKRGRPSTLGAGAVKVPVYFPREMYDRLAAQKRPISDVVRELVNKGLTENPISG